MGVTQGAKVRALDLIRRGHREVVWTPDFMRLGNLLSLSLWAFRDPERRRVLQTAALADCYPHFPGLRALAVERGRVPFTARRIKATGADGTFDPDYSRGEPGAFIREVLFPNGLPQPASNRIVVNVRRGDYYSDPHIRAVFGFNQRAYIRRAVLNVIERTPIIAGFDVVSDDVSWCEQNLQWLREYAAVSFNRSRDPYEHFVTIASAQYAILPNSTFSFWAGHLHDCIWPGNGADVWIPRFFARWPGGHDVSGVPSTWSVIEDIPGGWDAGVV